MVRFRVLAAALTLISGGLMMFAGYVGHTESWAATSPFTVAGGIVIVAAFASARRAELAEGSPRSPRLLRPPVRPTVIAAMLASGGLMVLAGYAGSAWSVVLIAPLALLGGLAVQFAFAIELRGDRER